MNATADTSLQTQEVLLQNLQQPSLYPHKIDSFTLLQTHISWVLLTGDFAYKFKKPVDLGFLDFSTLALRKHFCEEELRLNRRLAPELYLEVITLTGSPNQPVLNGDGPVIEYAIKMKQFPQSAQLDEVLNNRKLTRDHINKLAETVADFHQGTERATSNTAYGLPTQVWQPVAENFTHIRQSLNQQQYAARLNELEKWCQQQFSQLKDFIQQRKTLGYIREGHGDMHLRNLALLDGEVVLFDCLEFSPALRWGDVINDIAFLIMDLDDRQQTPLAWQFLNRYLELTGDYLGIKLLNFYKVYRALVRAKVDAIRLSQAHITRQEQENTHKDFIGYLELTEGYTQTASPMLILTRGVSGTGKTTYTQELLETIGAIRIRSDVERKRLYNDKPDLYSKELTQQVYQYLVELAGDLLTAGYRVIVDATFIDIKHIVLFQQLAEQMAIPFHILEFNAKADTLRHRVRQRKNDYSDANIKVLEQQLQHWQSVTDELKAHLIQLDTEHTIDIKQLAITLREH